jgi:RHS repeat-associated protein
MNVDGDMSVVYDYRANGLVNGISTTNPVTAAPMDFVFSYDDAGRRTGLTYPNGVTASYAYDEAGRLLAVEYRDSASQVLESLIYTYNGAGDRTSLDRLNIDPLPPAITNSTYPALPHANRMDTFNGEAIVYDDNGNMTQKGTMTLAWDVRDSLTSITNNPAGNASFAYDALGRRTEKTIGASTTKYLYDGLDIVKEMDGTGATKAWYVRTLNIDEPLARIEDDGTVRYYHTDALGSVIALTDGSGMVKTQYNYSPYGETQVIGEPSENPFQYTGRENDGTGLYAYRLRYYSPEMRSFISEDPIRFAGGMNWYAYVGNRPVNWTDALGLQGDINFGNRWTGRIDQFNVRGSASHEIHVFNARGKEVGIFGPRGWLNKHGFKGAPKNIPSNVVNKINGINIDLLRRQGNLPAKGRANIRGGRNMRCLGVLGLIPMILDAHEAEKRAEELCVSPWTIMTNDMLGIETQSNCDIRG